MNYVVSVYSYGGCVSYFDFTNKKKAISFAWETYRFMRSLCSRGDYGQTHVTVTRTALADNLSVMNGCVRYYG